MPNKYTGFGGNYYDMLHSKYRESYAGTDDEYSSMFDNWWKSKYDEFEGKDETGSKYFDTLLMGHTNPLIDYTVPSDPGTPGPGNETPPPVTDPNPPAWDSVGFWNDYLKDHSADVKKYQVNQIYAKDNFTNGVLDYGKLYANARGERINWNGQEAIRFYGAEGTAYDKSDDKVLGIVGLGNQVPNIINEKYAATENPEYVKYDTADYWRQYMAKNNLLVSKNIRRQYKGAYATSEDLLAASEATWTDQGDKYGLQMKTAAGDLLTTLNYNEKSDVPDWVKKQYGSPNLVLKNDYSEYMQDVPDALKQASESGHGQQWLRSNFESAISPYEQAYGKAVRSINQAKGAGGLRSGLGDYDKSMAQYELAGQAVGLKNQIKNQDTAYQEAALGTLNETNLYNKQMTQSLDQFNSEQEFTDYQMNLYRTQQGDYRKALQKAQNSKMWGEIIQGGASLLPYLAML